MDAKKIIKILSADKQYKHLFKSKEQSDEAYAVITRYCRAEGKYDEHLASQTAAKKAISTTRQQFEHSEDAYAKFMGDWQNVREATEKAKILASLDKNTNFALRSFMEELNNLKEKRNKIAADRKAYHAQCKKKIADQQPIVAAATTQLKLIAACIEDVRKGMNVADYGVVSLEKTERFFELGIARKLKGEESSFNTIGCTLFFDHNQTTGKWQFDTFNKVVNESLFKDTTIAINSKLQNEATGSFLVEILGELNLNVLDIKKDKNSKSSSQNNYSTSNTTTQNLSNGSDHTATVQTLDKFYDERYINANLSAHHANQNNNGTANKTEKKDKKVLSKTVWNEKRKEIRTQISSEVTTTVGKINKLTQLVQTIDKLKPVEQKSAVDAGIELIESILNLTNNGWIAVIMRRSPHLIAFTKLAKRVLPIIKAGKEIVDKVKALYDAVRGNDKDKFESLSRKLTTINEKSEEHSESIMRKNGYEKETTTNTGSGESTTNTNTTENNTTDTEYNNNSSQNDIKVGINGGIKQQQQNDLYTENIDHTYENAGSSESKTTNNSSSKATETVNNFTSDENDITIKDQFLLVLICETAEDGSLIVRKDSSSKLGPIETGLKHDKDLEISFDLNTKQLYTK